MQSHILEIQQLISREDCERFIQQSEEMGYETATINTDGGQRRVDEVRNNLRIIFDDPNLADQLWKLVADKVPQQIGVSRATGLNERFRFYKYLPGQQFRKHRDESFIRNETEASYYTFMVYLNGDFKGGHTTFQDKQINPETGKALIFLHNLEHEGSPVTEGVKYVLRTDIMYKTAAII